MLSINISELILTIASFFLLMFLLKKLLYGPLVAFMDARQARIDEGLRLEQQAEEKLSQARSENQKKLSEAQKQADELLEQSRSDARKGLEEELRQSATRADAAAIEARGEAKAKRETAAAELDGRRAELASLLARRLAGGPDGGSHI